MAMGPWPSYHRVKVSNMIEGVAGQRVLWQRLSHRTISCVDKNEYVECVGCRNQRWLWHDGDIHAMDLLWLRGGVLTIYIHDLNFRITLNGNCNMLETISKPSIIQVHTISPQTIHAMYYEIWNPPRIPLRHWSRDIVCQCLAPSNYLKQKTINFDWILTDSTFLCTASN